jgi:hypothetical protein
MLYSSFTIYKPYLLFIYDLCQSIQILQHTLKHVLKKMYKILNYNFQKC